MNSIPLAVSPVRLPFLDGLRAAAALWVMFGHIHLFTYGWSSHDFFLTKPLNLLLYMHLGVDVFLVLSGYCLALPAVAHGMHLRKGLGDYLKARARRILPPYLASLALILAVNAFLPLVAWGRGAAGMSGEIAGEVLLVNVLLLQDVFPHLNTINGPYWSVATEWHLYFLFPLALWLMRRYGPMALLAVAAAGATWLTWTSMHTPIMVESLSMAWPQPPYFVFLFACGVVTAWFTHGAGAVRRLQQSGFMLGAAALVCAAILLALLAEYRISDLASAHRFASGLQWIDPVAGVAAALLLSVLYRLPASSWPQRLLSGAVLQRLGACSYSLYLLHIPVLAAVLALLGQWPGLHVHAQFAIMATLGAAMALLVAHRFAILFERGGWRHLHCWLPGMMQRRRLHARIDELERENRRLRALLEDSRESPLRA